MKIFQRYALQFDGVDDYVEVPSVSGIATSTTSFQFTVLAWVYVREYPSYRTWILQLGQFGTDSMHWILRSDGSTQIGVWNGLQANPVLQKGEWIFIALAYNGANFTVYINGDVYQTLDDQFNFTSTIFRIGYVTNDYFNGIIDEVRIYNRALSPEEINILYNGGHVSSGLVCWLPMIEGSGTSVVDKSGNGNDGIIYGATWVDGKDVDVLRQRLGKVVLVRQI